MAPHTRPSALMCTLPGLPLALVAALAAFQLALTPGTARAAGQPALAVALRQPAGGGTLTAYTVMASGFAPNTSITEMMNDAAVIPPATGTTDASGGFLLYWTLDSSAKYCGTVTAKTDGAQASASFWVAAATDPQAGAACTPAGATGTPAATAAASPSPAPSPSVVASPSPTAAPTATATVAVAPPAGGSAGLPRLALPTLSRRTLAIAGGAALAALLLLFYVIARRVAARRRRALAPPRRRPGIARARPGTPARSPLWDEPPSPGVRPTPGRMERMPPRHGLAPRPEDAPRWRGAPGPPAIPRPPRGPLRRTLGDTIVGPHYGDGGHAPRDEPFTAERSIPAAGGPFAGHSEPSSPMPFTIDRASDPGASDPGASDPSGWRPRPAGVRRGAEETPRLAARPGAPDDSAAWSGAWEARDAGSSSWAHDWRPERDTSPSAVWRELPALPALDGDDADGADLAGWDAAGPSSPSYPAAPRGRPRRR